MMVISDIQLYQILRQKLGDKEAEALVEFVDSKLKANNDSNLNTLATKEDVANLRVEMKEMKAEMIKWMFIFWVSQLAATIAIVKLLI